MLSGQVIQTGIEELKAITKTDLCVMDMDGMSMASTMEKEELSMEVILDFVKSIADSQVVNGSHLFKIEEEGETLYVLLARGGADAYMVGKIAVSQIKQLLTAYRERFDRNNFFQNLLLDNLLLVDIYNRAKKLHIPVEEERVVYLLETTTDGDAGVMEMMRSLFTAQSGDYVTAVDEQNIILVKSLKKSWTTESLEETARTIMDMMNTEAMLNGRVAYGTVVRQLKDVSKSYKEAKMALEVGKIFYADKNVAAYGTLGIGRLIYQLPVSLCQVFIKEIFGSGHIPEELDEETLMTVNKFFENSLNISETSRQLFIHRNTLVYRLEKLEKAAGLDIRTFEDALTLKIALMVADYMEYLENQEY